MTTEAPAATASSTARARLTLLLTQRAVLRQQAGDDAIRLREIERGRPALEDVVATATDAEAIASADRQRRALDAEAKAIDNRREARGREERRLGMEISEAERALGTTVVAEVMVVADEHLGRILVELEAIETLRRKAVAEGAPDHLAPTPPGERRTTGVATFRVGDTLAALIRGEWAAEALPAARRVLEG